MALQGREGTGQFGSAPILCLQCGRLLALDVVVVDIHEHVPARDLSPELGAYKEGAGHLAVEGVGLLWRRREAVAQHDGDEVLDALGGALCAEVKRLSGGESLAQDHHRLHVGVHEGLAKVGRDGVENEHISFKGLLYISSLSGRNLLYSNFLC